MFNIGAGEVIVIALVLLVAVGPEQLPGLIRRVGKTVAEVRGMAESLRSEFMDSVDEMERAVDPKSWANSVDTMITEADEDDLDDADDQDDVAGDLDDVDDADDDDPVDEGLEDPRRSAAAGTPEANGHDPTNGLTDAGRKAVDDPAGEDPALGDLSDAEPSPEEPV